MQSLIHFKMYTLYGISEIGYSLNVKTESVKQSNFNIRGVNRGDFKTVNGRGDFDLLFVQ